MGDWKMVLMEQRAKQLLCWFEPFVKLRAPKMFNLRRDPFERADENSNTYWDWVISHAYLLYGMQALVAQQIEASSNFRRVRNRLRSISTQCWRKSRTQAAGLNTDSQLFGAAFAPSRSGVIFARDAQGQTRITTYGRSARSTAMMSAS